MITPLTYIWQRSCVRFLENPGTCSIKPHLLVLMGTTVITVSPRTKGRKTCVRHRTSWSGTPSPHPWGRVMHDSPAYYISEYNIFNNYKLIARVRLSTGVDQLVGGGHSATDTCAIHSPLPHFFLWHAWVRETCRERRKPFDRPSSRRLIDRHSHSLWEVRLWASQCLSDPVKPQKRSIWSEDKLGEDEKCFDCLKVVATVAELASSIPGLITAESAFELKKNCIFLA